MDTQLNTNLTYSFPGIQFDEFRFSELIYAFLMRIRAGLAAQADSWAVERERKRSRRISGDLAGAQRMM